MDLTAKKRVGTFPTHNRKILGTNAETIEDVYKHISEFDALAAAAAFKADADCAAAAAAAANAVTETSEHSDDESDSSSFSANDVTVASGRRHTPLRSLEQRRCD